MSTKFAYPCTLIGRAGLIVDFSARGVGVPRDSKNAVIAGKEYDSWGMEGWELYEPKPTDTFTKNDSTKPALSFPLGMSHALGLVATVMAYGAEKYEKDNWKLATGTDIDRYLDAALRHLSAHCSGELIDEESGNSHMSHALTSLMMYTELKGKS